MACLLLTHRISYACMRSGEPVLLDAAQKDVVDRDVDKLDEEANEAHDQKSNASGVSYPGKL